MWVGALNQKVHTCAAGCSSAAVKVSQGPNLTIQERLTELDGPYTGPCAHIEDPLSSLGTRREVCHSVEGSDEVGMLHVCECVLETSIDMCR